MVKSKLVDLIKMRLGNRTDTEIVVRINAELDMAQYELERFGLFTPWFLLSTDVTLNTVAGTASVSIPSDMLQEYEEGALFYNGLPLRKHDPDYLAVLYQGVGQAAPQMYALVNDDFVLYPTPDQVYNLTMKYYQADTIPSGLADSGENQWLRHAADWLLAKAGKAVARYIKDADAVQKFAEDEGAAEKRVYTVHVDRAERNSPRVMGDV